MNGMKEIPITIEIKCSKEDGNSALTEARQYVLEKMLNKISKIKQLKSEEAC